MATINQIKQERRKGIADAYKQVRAVNSQLEQLTRFLRNLKSNRVKIPEGKDWDRVLQLASQTDSAINSLVSNLSAGTQLYTTVQ